MMLNARCVAKADLQISFAFNGFAFLTRVELVGTSIIAGISAAFPFPSCLANEIEPCDVFANAEIA
jgi:hypothetical protein